MNYDTAMQAARMINAQRDRDDRRNGFATPNDGPVVEHIRTAMMAIEAGIKSGDWTAIVEGQAMLESIVLRMDN